MLSQTSWHLTGLLTIELFLALGAASAFTEKATNKLTTRPVSRIFGMSSSKQDKITTGWTAANVHVGHLGTLFRQKSVARFRELAHGLPYPLPAKGAPPNWLADPGKTPRLSTHSAPERVLPVPRPARIQPGRPVRRSARVVHRAPDVPAIEARRVRVVAAHEVAEKPILDGNVETIGPPPKLAKAPIRACALHHSSCLTLRLRFNLPQPGVSTIRAAPQFALRCLSIRPILHSPRSRYVR